MRPGTLTVFYSAWTPALTWPWSTRRWSTPWGQRAIRFYDPDCHMIEVGEDMVQVTGRFRDQGMSPTEIARRMDVPEDYVAHCLALLDGGQ